MKNIESNIQIISNKNRWSSCRIGFLNSTNDDKIEEIETNYINKSELVRNDTIDFVYKFINRKLTLTAEDNFNEYSGFVVMYIHILKTNEFHDIYYLKNWIYIKFVNRTITEYKDVNENKIDPITNENAVVEGLNKCEENRNTYYPNDTVSDNSIK